MLGFVNDKKRCTGLAASSDKVYQLLAHGRWFSPGTQVSSTNKTGHHNIAEILLKVALNTMNQIKSFISGHYMLVEGASGNFFTRANLDTPVLQSTAASCRVTFWYHMFGALAGTVFVSYCK